MKGGLGAEMLPERKVIGPNLHQRIDGVTFGLTRKSVCSVHEVT